MQAPRLCVARQNHAGNQSRDIASASRRGRCRCRKAAVCSCSLLLAASQLKLERDVGEATAPRGTWPQSWYARSLEGPHRRMALGRSARPSAWQEAWLGDGQPSQRLPQEAPGPVLFCSHWRKILSCLLALVIPLQSAGVLICRRWRKCPAALRRWCSCCPWAAQPGANLGYSTQGRVVIAMLQGSRSCQAPTWVIQLKAAW